MNARQLPLFTCTELTFIFGSLLVRQTVWRDYNGFVISVSFQYI